MQLASEDGFRADPPLVWRWYAWRRGLVANARPNAGHYALASAQSRFDSFELITQNVDGLHARAGSAPIELHGSIMRTVCLARCGFAEDDPKRLPPGEPPRCPRCNDWLRPDVVWFGEMLDAATLQQAQVAAARCDVMLVIGTSGLVYPAAGLPAEALRNGAKVVIVNPQASELDELATVVVRGTAAVELAQALCGRLTPSMRCPLSRRFRLESRAFFLAMRLQLVATEAPSLPHRGSHPPRVAYTTRNY